MRDGAASAAAVDVNRRLPEASDRRSLVQGHGGHPGERHHGACDLSEPSEGLGVHDLHPELDTDDVSGTTVRVKQTYNVFRCY